MCRAVVSAIVAGALTIFASAAFVVFYFSCPLQARAIRPGAAWPNRSGPKNPAMSPAVPISSGERTGTRPMGPMPAASSLPDPETIRRTAEQVLRRPDYQLDPQPDSGVTILEWLLARSSLDSHAVSMAARRPGGPSRLAALADRPRSGRTAHPARVPYRIYDRQRRDAGPGRSAAWPRISNVRRAIPPRSNARRPRRCPAATSSPPSGCCSLACLLRLELAEKRTFRAGTTNREHLRRHRGFAGLRAPRAVCRDIETRWYGRGVCGLEDFEACRAAHARIRDFTQELLHAHRA